MASTCPADVAEAAKWSREHPDAKGDDAVGMVAPAPAVVPAPVAVSLPVEVYFDVGAAAFGADGSKTVAVVADLIQKDGLRVTVTGCTDKTGDVAKNEALGTNGAAAVRDALRAACVAEASVEMKPPMFV